MSFGTPVKVKLNFKIDDLDEEYLEKLYVAIPILEDQELLQLILNYCEEMQNTEQLKSNKVKSILRQINGKLKKLKKIVYNIELNTSNKRNTEKKNNNKNNTKFLKYDIIDCTSLIEAVIAFTFNYYNPDISPTIRLNSSNNSRFIHRMNKIQGITLYDYIITFFSDLDFKTNFLIILHNIASKLLELQDNYLFIHGDLHLRNIMILENMNIIFIDFGHSTIKLQTNNGKTIILSASVESNIERRLPLNLMEFSILRGIDLMHLFRELLYVSQTNGIDQRLRLISENLNELCYFTRRFNSNGLHKIRTQEDLNRLITTNVDKSIIFPQNLLKLNLNKSTNAYKYGNYNSSKKRGSNGSNESIVKKLSFLFGNN